MTGKKVELIESRYLSDGKPTTGKGEWIRKKTHSCSLAQVPALLERMLRQTEEDGCARRIDSGLKKLWTIKRSTGVNDRDVYCTIRMNTLLALLGKRTKGVAEE